MIIRKYRELPALYLPDVGEIVLARRSGADKYVKAVILTKPRRIPGGKVKFKVQWLESDRSTGGEGREPIIQGEVGWIETGADDWPLKVKQINKGQPLGG